MHFGISEGKGGLKHGSRPWLGMDIFWNCPILLIIIIKVFKMYEMCEDNPTKLQQHSKLNCLDQGHSPTSSQVVLDVTFLMLQQKVRSIQSLIMFYCQTQSKSIKQ